MKSKIRTVLSILVLVAASAMLQPVAADPVSLLGTWETVAEDFVPFTAILKFTVQEAKGSDFSLEGFFVWQEIGGSRGGTELFRGTLFSNSTVELQGYQLINASGIQLSKYNGTLSVDGNTISGTYFPPPGVWTVTRQTTPTPPPSPVPEPTTLLLLGSGLAGLGARILKRKPKNDE